MMAKAGALLFAVWTSGQFSSRLIDRGSESYRHSREGHGFQQHYRYSRAGETRGLHARSLAAGAERHLHC